MVADIQDYLPKGTTPVTQIITFKIERFCPTDFWVDAGAIALIALWLACRCKAIQNYQTWHHWGKNTLRYIVERLARRKWRFFVIDLWHAGIAQYNCWLTPLWYVLTLSWQLYIYVVKVLHSKDATTATYETGVWALKCMLHTYYYNHS
mgnify:CR=1 FL=1